MKERYYEHADVQNYLNAFFLGGNYADLPDLVY